MTPSLSSSTNSLSPRDIASTLADSHSPSPLLPRRTISRSSIQHDPLSKEIGSFFTSSNAQDPLENITAVNNQGSQFPPAAQITEAFHQIESNLVAFLSLGKEEPDLSKIFVLSKEGNHLELHENNLQSDLTINASHEEVKSFFANQLIQLYGEEAVSFFYPQEERAHPLTLARAHQTIASLVALQDSITAACAGDLSTYDTCLREQLHALKELRATLTHPPAATSSISSLLTSLAEQTGLSRSMIYTGFLAGSFLAAGAAVGGLSFSVAFSAAMMTASPHLPLLGAAASASATAKAGTSLWVGWSASQLYTQYGASTLAALAHVSAPTAWGGGTGALLGALGGGIAASGTAQNPSSSGRIITGMLAGGSAGALLGGLAAALYPHVGSLDATLGSTGALMGTYRGGREGGQPGAIRGLAQGAAAGLLAGGGIALFGGLCSMIANLGISGISLEHTYEGVAGATALAAGLMSVVTERNTPPTTNPPVSGNSIAENVV